MSEQPYNEPVMSHGSKTTAELQLIRALLLFGYSACEDAESVGYSSPNLI
jgi:hypothetical protein